MTGFVVDDMAAPWTSSSPLWSLSSTVSADALGRGGRGMLIRAEAGTADDPAPTAERHFAPPLDLRAHDELRLWLRGTRPGDGGAARPYYLVIEATADPPTAGPVWRRFLPVVRPDTFVLHRLWLGDMPDALRRGVALLRLRGLDPTVGFEAAVDDLIAVRPEAVTDVDEALVARFGDFGVPAIVDLAGDPAARTPPFVLITPWSLLPLDRQGGTDEIVDNFTDGGAFVRPAPAALQLEFRLDVIAADRAEQSRLLELLIASLFVDTRLVVANVPLKQVPFTPSSEVAATIEPGGTPLFLRVTNEVEAGPRTLLPFAAPFVVAGPADGRETAEATPV